MNTGARMAMWLVIIIIILGIIGVIYAITNNSVAPTTIEDTTTQIPTQSEVTNTYTLADIALHGTKADCWMAIEGKVYDVTKMIDQHPGGEAVLEGCGKDATVLFKTRPMGSGTPHSDKAEAGLENFYIGDLKTS